MTLDFFSLPLENSTTPTILLRFITKYEFFNLYSEYSMFKHFDVSMVKKGGKQLKCTMGESKIYYLYFPNINRLYAWISINIFCYAPPTIGETFPTIL